MSNLLVVVNLPHVSGLPEEVIQNTFAFIGPGTDEADAASALSQIEQFYANAQLGATYAMSGYLSPEVSRSTDTVASCYSLTGHLDGSPHGSPIQESTFALALPESTQPMPSETAAVISFAADLTDIPEEQGLIRPRARRRGRIYFGPLNVVATVITDSRRYLSPEFLVDCKENFEGALGGAGPVELGVWSRSDEIIREATTAFVDNALDTQRRREVQATTRTTFFL